MRITEGTLKSHGPVSGREWEMIEMNLELGGDTFALVATSIPDTGLRDASCIKGELVLDVMLIEPVAEDATRSHVVDIILFDPKGHVPAVLVNSILSNFALFYEKTRDKLNTLE